MNISSYFGVVRYFTPFVTIVSLDGNLYSFSLSGYVSINYQSDNCDRFALIQNNQSIRLDRQSTSYYFEHEDNSSGPISNCRYIFKIISLVSIYNVSFSEIDIFFPYICRNSAEPLVIEFSFLPFNRTQEFLTIFGKWKQITTEELQYTLKVSIFFENGTGAHIIIDQKTISNYFTISSEDVVCIIQLHLY